MTFCFLLVSGIAPGTMPVAQAGGFAIVICTGHGPVTVFLDRDGQPIEQSRDLCDWAKQHGNAVAPPPGPPCAGQPVAHKTPDAPAVHSAGAGHHVPEQNLIRAPPSLL